MLLGRENMNLMAPLFWLSITVGKGEKILRLFTWASDQTPSEKETPGVIATHKTDHTKRHGNVIPNNAGKVCENINTDGPSESKIHGTIILFKNALIKRYESGTSIHKNEEFATDEARYG